MGTKIENASEKATSTTTDIELYYIPLGKSGISDSVAIRIDELQDTLSVVSDKIEEGTTKVETIEDGTPRVIVDVNGILQFTVENGILYPASTLDLGKATNPINDIHIKGGFQMGASDATGDLYYRDSSGNLERLAIDSDATKVLGTNGTIPTWVAGGSGSGDSRWVTWTGAAASVGGQEIGSTTHLDIGTPVRFRVGNGDYKYAVVTSISSNAHSISGYECKTSEDYDDFQYGTPELIKSIEYVIPGAFADDDIIAGLAAGLLHDDMLMQQGLSWNYPTAYLVGLKAICTTNDTSSAPNIQPVRGVGTTYTNIYGVLPVNNSGLAKSIAEAPTAYKFTYEDRLDFNVNKGTAGDARDLTIYLTFILE